MTYRPFFTLAIAATTSTVAASAQTSTPSIDVAALQLAVTELRGIDSIVTRQGALRPLPGRRFVVATLRGEATSNGRLISSPTLFAAQVQQQIVPARAFAFSTAREGQPHWVVRPDGDPSEAPTLHAIVRQGPVQVHVLFEIPISASGLQVALPTRVRGVTSISGP